MKLNLAKQIQSNLMRYVLCIGFLIFISADNVRAAEHRVSSSTSTVDCSSMGVGPGDSIILEGTSRGNLKIVNCIGAIGSRITVRNDSSASGPLVINATGKDGYRGIDCNNCEYIDIDGTGKWSGAPSGTCGVGSNWVEGRTQCGIQIRRAPDGDPTILLMMRGSSKNFSIRGVEIDGRSHRGPAAGIGLYINDHSYDKDVHPGEWRENILIRNNYFHDTHHEGMYAGPNYGLVSDNSVGDLELRNIEVAYNLVEDTGWSGLQFKTATQGDNSLHHNVIRRTGWIAAANGDVGHANGLHIDNSHGKIYNNYVEEAGGEGIAFRVQYLPSSFGPRDCEIYNNVVVRAGEVLSARGISVWRSDSNKANPVCDILNNTIVETTGNGVSVASGISGNVIRDNLIAGSSGSHVSGGSSSVSNNAIGSVESMSFVDPAKEDFHLTQSSPALNQGSAFGFPATDHDGVARPQEGAPDQGAFEYLLGGSGAQIPKPPNFVQAQ